MEYNLSSEPLITNKFIMRNKLIEIFKDHQQELGEDIGIGSSMYGVMADKVIEELKAGHVDTIVSLPEWVKEGALFEVYDNEDGCFYKAKIVEIDMHNEMAWYKDIDQKSDYLCVKFEIGFSELNNPDVAREAN